MLLSHAAAGRVSSQGRAIIAPVYPPPNRGTLHLFSLSPPLLLTGLEFHKYSNCELPLVIAPGWNLWQSILSQDAISQQDQANKC